MNSQQKEELKDRLIKQLHAINGSVFPLPGLINEDSYQVLSKQLVDSISRVAYVRNISNETHSIERANPDSVIFDPLRAAVIRRNQKQLDDACWLVFLATHYGKSIQSNWLLARETYGAHPRRDSIWTWDAVAQDRDGFITWYSEYYDAISRDTLQRKFSNHRKYESLNPEKNKSSLDVILSYSDWIIGYGSHKEMFENARRMVGDDPRDIFDYIYKTMKVLRFGRMGKFDFLTMLGKLDLYNLEPKYAYIKNSTGPAAGCRKLFGNVTINQIERNLSILDDKLDVGPMAKQVLEDAICNWQKSPQIYIKFRG